MPRSRQATRAMIAWTPSEDNREEDRGHDGVSQVRVSNGWTPRDAHREDQRRGPHGQPGAPMSECTGANRCQRSRGEGNAQNERDPREPQYWGWGPGYSDVWTPSYPRPLRRVAIIGRGLVGTVLQIRASICSRVPTRGTETRNRSAETPGDPTSSPRDQNPKSPGVKGVTLAGPSDGTGYPRGRAPTPTGGWSA